jgi:hypothetical protein
VTSSACPRTNSMQRFFSSPHMKRSAAHSSWAGHTDRQQGHHQSAQGPASVCIDKEGTGLGV